MTSPSGTAAVTVGDGCTQDYVLISGVSRAVRSTQCITYPAPDGASSVGGTPTTDRYCGATQLQASTTATETTVYTTRQPYQVTPATHGLNDLNMIMLFYLLSPYYCSNDE